MILTGSQQITFVCNESRRLRAIIAQVIGLALNVLIGISTTHASTWNQPAFGVYSSASSWIGGVPTDYNYRSADFGATVGTTFAPERVLFVNDGGAYYTRVVSGDYTFQFGNPDLRFSSGDLIVGSSYMAAPGSPLADDAKLTIDIGSYGYAGTVVANAVLVGVTEHPDTAAPRSGTLLLTGQGTRLESRHSFYEDQGVPSVDLAYVLVGDNGSTGRIEVLDGATFSTDTAYVDPDGNYAGDSLLRVGVRTTGSPIGGNGVLLVSGAGSLVDAGDGIWLGNGGNGAAEIAAGGAIKTHSIGFGWEAGVGHLNISGWSQDAVTGAVYGSHVDTQYVQFNEPNSVIEVVANPLNSFEDPKAYMVIGDEAAAADPQKHINGGVYLDATGSFTGSGTIVGKLVIGPGAHYSPGSSPGILHVDGDFDLLSGATLMMEIGGLTPSALYDQLDVSGDLTLAGNVRFSLLNGFSLHSGDRIDLFHVGGAFNASGATFTWLNKPAGLIYDTSFVDGSYSLHITSVPEPSTWLLGLVGAVGVTLARSCNRRKFIHRTMRLNASLAIAIALPIAVVRADDVRWFGNQGGQVAVGGVGSFFDGINWEGFAPPGDEDRALFGSGAAPVLPGTPPRVIHFGDATLNYVGASGGFVSGGTATVGSLGVMSNDWVFDFDSWNTINGTTGNLYVLGTLVVGTDMQDAGQQPGTARLSLVGAGEARTNIILVGQTMQAVGTLEIGAGAVLRNSLVTAVGDSGNGTMIVRGAGAALLDGTAPSYLTIGKNNGSSGRLEIVEGGTVDNGNGAYLGSEGHAEVLIDGADSNWRTTSLWLGANGGTGELTIRNGGIASLTGYANLGVATGGHGSLEVRSGGLFQSAGIELGQSVTSQGKVLASGNESRIESGWLNVGVHGAGQLDVKDHAIVQLGEGLSVGWFGDSTGAVTVSSGASLLTGQWITIGRDGDGSLVGEGGGKVESNWASIASTNGSRGDVKLAGVGTQWTIATSASLGHGDSGGGGAAQMVVKEEASLLVGSSLTLGALATIQVETGGRIIVGNDDSSNVPSDTIWIGPGGSLSGTGELIGDVLVNGGVVSPGFSPGTLHISGNYVQGALGTLNLEVAGALPSQFDQLDVRGNLLLGGTVILSLIDGYLPQLGDEFDLFRVGGDFDAATAKFYWVNAPAGLRYDTSFANGTYALRVTAVPEPSTWILAVVALAGLLVFRKS
jgi:T5SS/PEP-CTERM-associated repeat protein